MAKSRTASPIEYLRPQLRNQRRVYITHDQERMKSGQERRQIRRGRSLCT